MSIGAVTIILIVLLRITIGWHFFYEGLHKFDPRHDFSSYGFLGQAKGPTADLYYMMLPDLHGLVRLQITPKEEVQPYRYHELIEKLDTKANKLVIAEEKEQKIDNLPTFPVYEDAWSEYKQLFEKSNELTPEETKQVEAVFGQYIRSLREYAAEVEKDVVGYYGSIQRYREMLKEMSNDAPHQRERNWNAEMNYRSEMNKWVKELDEMGNGLQSAFGRVLAQEMAGAERKIVTDPEKATVPNPVTDSHVRLLDLSVTYGLTAIGLCMMLGLCNRLACLGAVAFLANVCLSQFPWPTVYPPTPDVIGHFMIVTKDFVELVACLVLASLPAGRWGGLDFFLYHCFGGKKIAESYGLKDS